MNPDVVVIGSGIVGCSCAYYLARAKVNVLLVDQQHIGSGASKAGMTHVATWEGPDINLALSRASIQEYHLLNKELPFGFEFTQVGGLVVIENPSDLGTYLEEVEHLQKWGVRCQVLSNEELNEYEPNLAPDLAGGVIYLDDLQVNPLLVTQSLTLGAKNYGARTAPFTKVTGFELSPSGDELHAVVTDKGRIVTKSVVIAAGAWSGVVGSYAGIDIPIVPRKGTLILTQAVSEDFLRHKSAIAAGYVSSVKNESSQGLVGSPVIYQTRNGNLILGSSRQFVGFDLTVDPMVVAIMLKRCLRYMPGLAGISALRTWSGLRPYSPDLLPIISPLEEIKGMFIAAGHEGLGITEGPITGKLISQMITGVELDIPLGELAFSRFQKQCSST